MQTRQVQIETVMISHPDHASDFHQTIYAPLEWQRRGLQKTASGYGTKLPTTKMIDFAGKRRRIYADIYGNSGHTYFILNKEKITVY